MSTTATATITVEQVMALRPRAAWWRKRVINTIFGGDASRVLSIRDFAGVNVMPVADRLSILLRHPLATDRLRRLYACQIAEQALDLVESRVGTVDPRLREAIAVSRRFAVGQATLKELAAARSAANTAAWSSASRAYWSAAWAAKATASSASADAAFSASAAAEGAGVTFEAQLAILVKMFEEAAQKPSNTHGETK